MLAWWLATNCISVCITYVKSSRWKYQHNSRNGTRLRELSILLLAWPTAECIAHTQSHRGVSLADGTAWLERTEPLSIYACMNIQQQYIHAWTINESWQKMFFQVTRCTQTTTMHMHEQMYADVTYVESSVSCHRLPSRAYKMDPLAARMFTIMPPCNQKVRHQGGKISTYMCKLYNCFNTPCARKPSGRWR